MANEEHAAILKRGVEAWNAWRRHNPGLRPALRGANLYRATLSGADLHSADLIQATLTLADGFAHRGDP